MDGGQWWAWWGGALTLGNSRKRSVVPCTCPTLPFLAYIFRSHFIPPLSSRAWVVVNFSMADVSDARIQEGQFPNNVENVPAACGDTEPNSVFIAYLDVRSDKSETNWLLLDYEARVFPPFEELLLRADLALW